MGDLSIFRKIANHKTDVRQKPYQKLDIDFDLYKFLGQ